MNELLETKEKNKSELMAGFQPGFSPFIYFIN